MSALKGIRFFIGKLPSFTAIGFHVRKRKWRPIRSDFRKQTWVVTGASDGIGYAIAELAALNGARVIAIGRSIDKLQTLKSKTEIKLKHRTRMRPQNEGYGAIVPVVADLSDMDEISRLCKALNQKIRIDVLINNVGILNDIHKKTREGFEQSYAVNLLGQYHFTENLFASGTFAKAPLIIAMSSGGLYNAPLNLKLLNQSPKDFDGPMAYASHKRAQLGLVDYWRRKHREIDVFTYTMHPGWVRTTGVERSMPLFSALLQFILRTPYQGADTAIWLAQKRPRTSENIVWFDRKPRSVHLFKDTRRPRTTIHEVIKTMNGHLTDVLR